MKLFVHLGKGMEDHDISNSFESDEISQELVEDTSDLPTSLIITNLDATVFNDPEQKDIFESIFRQYDPNATFQYFKSFRRIRVNFESPALAAKARIHAHQTQFGDSIINCYFAQQQAANKNRDTSCSDAHLHPPAPVRQYLISPPASPPVGWEPVEEAEPCINYDLLAAIAALTPGESHEIHPPSESQPGIVVHTCDDQRPANAKLKIEHTKCPGRNSSLDSSESPSPPSSPTGTS